MPTRKAPGKDNFFSGAAVTARRSRFGPTTGRNIKGRVATVYFITVYHHILEYFGNNFTSFAKFVIILCRGDRLKMIPPLIKDLAEEKIVFLDSAKEAKLPFKLKGIIRLVDAKGRTLGILLDRKILEDIEEDAAATNQNFLNSIEQSRRSGRISSQAVKKKANLK